MKTKDKIFGNKIHFIIFGSVLLTLIFFYVVLFLIKRDIVSKYDNTILPSVYLDEYDMSNYDFDEAKEILDQKKDQILAKKVLLNSQDREIEVTLGEMGLVINEEKTLQQIKNFQGKLSNTKKVWYIYNHNKIQSFRFYFLVDDAKFQEFFQNLQAKANVEPVNGHFDTSEGVKYIAGVNGFHINYDQNLDLFKKYFQGDYDPINMKINLIGDVVEAYTNESYLSIDTMTSSFSTEYDTWITLRAQNLRTGINYVNGAIVEPGEVFSFYRYAGPYNKQGYVFYYEYVGNGVCQVATTVYDSALLGGLEIVTRSPHKKKSVYVAGGLDATVASANDGSWNTDMQFRNTYNYPIYIKAYDADGSIHVEFWSNHDAKEGKTYETESVWLGGRGYRTFLHTYKDGVEIANDVITTTWYPEG